MNCKPGDLAIVVRVFHSHENKLLGRVVKCVRQHSHPITGEPGWVIEPESDLGDCILDECLRPIRPGDISDEEVRDLYAPKLPEVAL